MKLYSKDNKDIYELADGEVVAFPQVKITGFEEALSPLTKTQREKLISGYDIKNFAKVFEDEGMMNTARAFLDNGMNVSLTSRKLYMHRNTLIYKLNAIRRMTGLDLRDFNMAVTFEIVHTLYVMNRGNSAI